MYDFGNRTPTDLKDKWRDLEKNEEECLRRLRLAGEAERKRKSELNKQSDQPAQKKQRESDHNFCISW